MIDEPDAEIVPNFPWASLTPYLSVVVLECTAENPAHSFGAVHRHLARGARETSTKARRIVAMDEFDSTAGQTLADIGTLEEIGLDQVAGFVRRISSPPGWTDDTSEFVDTTHELCLMFRRGDLLAIKLEDGAIDRLQRWLDKVPLPNVRRIAPKVLGYTFLMGETRGLWLQGAHSRSTRRPDAKTSVGLDLRDAIDPFDDSSFSLGSARCQMPSDPELVQLRGAVGATMKTSQLWFKQMPDLRSFVEAMVEVFKLIEEASKDESLIVEAFPQLARDVTDLTEVFGAYEATPVDLETMPQAAAGEEAREASALLQDAVLSARGGSDSAKFKLDVGLDGSETGTLTVRPEAIPHGFKLNFGFHSEPHVLEPTRRVLDALEAGDLLTVYYESGHVYSRGRISARNTYIAPFPKWDFKEFPAFVDIEMEKPSNLKSTKSIHAQIGKENDASLFGWVSRTYSDGWLICDDGSGETADFLQISTDGVLRIIHVKGAKSHSPNRGVSAAAYEVVASQASKNLIYMDRKRLTQRLTTPPTARPACWEDGKRSTSRSDFLDMLTSPTEVEVVIIQPHLNEPLYDRVRAEDPDAKPSQDLLRLRLLETLLNSARASIVKSGAELIVVGSKST